MRLLGTTTVGLKGKRKATASVLPPPSQAVEFNDAAKSQYVAVLIEDF